MKLIRLLKRNAAIITSYILQTKLRIAPVALVGDGRVALAVLVVTCILSRACSTA